MCVRVSNLRRVHACLTFIMWLGFEERHPLVEATGRGRGEWGAGYRSRH